MQPWVLTFLTLGHGEYLTEVDFVHPLINYPQGNAFLIYFWPFLWLLVIFHHVALTQYFCLHKLCFHSFACQDRVKYPEMMIQNEVLCSLWVISLKHFWKSMRGVTNIITCISLLYLQTGFYLHIYLFSQSITAFISRLHFSVLMEIHTF